MAGRWKGHGANDIAQTVNHEQYLCEIHQWLEHATPDLFLILGLCPAKERQGYFVTTSLIGWVQA